jgi:hypothetical protein
MPRPIPVPVRQAMFRLWQRVTEPTRSPRRWGWLAQRFAVSKAGSAARAPRESRRIIALLRLSRRRPPA